MPPLVSSDSAVSDAMPPEAREVGARASRRRSRTPARRRTRRCPARARSSRQRSRVRPGQLARAARRRVGTDGSSRPSRATSALRWNSARSASSSPRVSPGNASLRRRRRAPTAALISVARVVVLELDSAPAAAPATRSDRGAGVGGHQEGEVRRALRRRQPQPHRHVTVVGHDQGADEAERGDRLVELRVVDRPERFEDSGTERSCRRPLRFLLRPARRPGRSPRSSAGTSTP